MTGLSRISVIPPQHRSQIFAKLFASQRPPIDPLSLLLSPCWLSFDDPFVCWLLICIPLPLLNSSLIPPWLSILSTYCFVDVPLQSVPLSRHKSLHHEVCELLIDTLSLLWYKRWGIVQTNPRPFWLPRSGYIPHLSIICNKSLL